MHLPMPEAAPVTRAVLFSRRILTSTPLRLDAISRGPAETVLGAGARGVFATDPALVAQAVDRLDHGRKVDLPFVGFVARRHRRDLHVADQRKKLLEAFEQIAADDLD